MNQTVVTRLMKAIEIAYKEHLPQWEFPNKEIWIQQEKEQMIDFAFKYGDLTTREIADSFDKEYKTNEK
jgi:hypothetical protein